MNRRQLVGSVEWMEGELATLCHTISVLEARINHLTAQGNVFMSALDSLKTQEAETVATLDAVVAATRNLLTRLESMESKLEQYSKIDEELAAMTTDLAVHTSAAKDVLPTPKPVEETPAPEQVDQNGTEAGGPETPVN